MINFEDLKEKSVNEMQEILENDNTAFSAIVSSLTMDELTEQESVIVQALENYDKYLDDVSYELQEKTEFDHREYTRAQVSNIIVDFVNKQEVDWQYSLGMYQICKLWKSIGKGQVEAKINYKALDSTLRLLGAGKYKGYEEWRGILAVNQYLTNVHDLYNKDTTYMIYLSHLHNSVLNEMNKSRDNKSEMIMESENV